LPLEADDPAEDDGQQYAENEITGVDCRMADGGQDAHADTFLSGAHARSSRFSPTLVKRTTASALSSLPMTSSTTPSPHFPCTTSSPADRPSRSLPLVRAGVAPRPRMAASTMSTRP